MLYISSCKDLVASYHLGPSTDHQSFLSFIDTRQRGSPSPVSTEIVLLAVAVAWSSPAFDQSVRYFSAVSKFAASGPGSLMELHIAHV